MAIDPSARIDPDVKDAIDPILDDILARIVALEGAGFPSIPKPVSISITNDDETVDVFSKA